MRIGIPVILVCLLAAPAASDTLFSENFDHYAAVAHVSAAWDLSRGWELHSGALGTANRDRALAVAFACPEVRVGEIRASVTPHTRAASGGWAAAGLMLYQGPDHYWRLALVESPTGEHYCELVEQYGGAWQAQNMGRTALARDDGASEPWAYDQTYDLRITLSAESILGEVRAADRVIFARTYFFAPQALAVRSGRAALETIAMNASFDNVSVTGEGQASIRPPDRPMTAAILDQPGGEEIARVVAEALRQAQYQTTILDSASLGDPRAFNRARFDLIVLPRCEAIPGPGLENLLAFLRCGGHLIAFGGPPFRDILWPWRGEWKSADQILAQVRADAEIVNFRGADLTQWTRASSNARSAVEHKLVPGPEGRSALQVSVADLAGWETFASPRLDEPFPAGRAVTCFWAKGGPRTSHLVVEWNERDGSRWIAAVELGGEWRHYALRPQDFKFWPDGSPRDRGGAGDVFNPQNAARIVFGLAQSHSPVPNGEHVYWVADVGAARSPFPVGDIEPPTLEGMSPWYKVYEVALEADTHRLTPDPQQRFGPPFEPVAVSGRVVSPVWRQRGLGQGAGQRGRWVPLVRVVTQQGQYRGVAAATYIATSGPYRGATWTYIGLDPDVARQHRAIFAPLITNLAQRLAAGLLLASGGAEQFSYFAEPTAQGAPPPRLTARVINIGLALASAQVRFTVADAAHHPVFEATRPTTLSPGSVISVGADCPPLPPGRYEAACELISGSGEVIDRIAHEFCVIAPPQNPRFVAARGGDFYLGGKQWYPHGVNFWPSYVAGLERFDYWIHWLSPSQYDPEPVERDLAMLESLGVNMVSIQYGNVDQAPALNDFFQRAKAHGIHVNVFIPGTHPLAFDPALVESLVRAARLDRSDAMFAYDLAWEPRLGAEEERRQYDSAWNAWIEERYGSIEAAQRDWGYTLRRIDGKPTGPTDQQLLEDGTHRRMVAAYRRFADDLISQGYGRVTRFLRRLDPNHLFGARTGYGGTGQRGVAPVMPFDMVSGAAHLDFASPEGWGLWGAWPNFERAGFTTLYGRWASSGKPVFWAEFGYTIYPGTTPEKYLSQAEVYRNLYRMVLQSGASGSAGWWYPGGLRVDENSDFGIINPDGTPRPAAQELRNFAPQITAPRDRPEPDTWITFDRDADVSGYAGVWERHADEYVAAIRAGKAVALRTGADGATSADCPLTAVGGTPYNGSNPPKYLNGEFGGVAVIVRGKEIEVTDGAVIEVPAGQEIRLSVQVINTGVAAWISPQSAQGGPGAVYVASGERGGFSARLALPRDVPRYGTIGFESVLTQGISERTDVTLAMLADGRAWFGQRLRFTLVPAAAR